MASVDEFLSKVEEYKNSMFNRKQSRIDLGEGLFRYKVRYETLECEPFTPNGLLEQNTMLKSVVESPELLFCGRGRFQDFKMYHDGLRWVIELQRDDHED